MTDKLRPKEGWHVLHLYYRIDFSSWHLLSNEEKFAAKTSFSELIQKIRAFPETQLLTLSMISAKADLGFMLLTEDLHAANSAEKELGLALGPDVLTPAYSFYSLTERSEYTTSEEEFGTSLIEEKGLSKDSAEFSQAIEDFRVRMKKYLQDRLYPNLPDWPLVCFYPMSKRRNEQQNWYALPFTDRKRLMADPSPVRPAGALGARPRIIPPTGPRHRGGGGARVPRAALETKSHLIST